MPDEFCLFQSVDAIINLYHEVYIVKFKFNTAILVHIKIFSTDPCSVIVLYLHNIARTYRYNKFLIVNSLPGLDCSITLFSAILNSKLKKT